MFNIGMKGMEQKSFIFMGTIYLPRQTILHFEVKGVGMDMQVMMIIFAFSFRTSQFCSM